MASGTEALYTTLRHLAETTNDFVLSPVKLVPRPLPKRLRPNQVASSELLTSSATVHCFREPTLRPRLPVEILDAICFHLPSIHVKPLLFANSFMSALARRRLYHTVSLTSSRDIVRFMKTLTSNTELATLVRAIDFHLSLSLPTSNLYRLLQRTLRLTTGLISLSLELPKTQSPLWIFDSCTFKLKQFTTSMYCRRALATFLETQSSIVDLTLRGYQADALFFLPFVDPIPSSLQVDPSETFILSPESLPRLKSFNAVHADACVIQAVVAGRPVQMVSIPLFPEMSIVTLDTLKLSTASLKRLSVISFDPSAPFFLFEALATRFEELEALHIVMLMAEYSNEMLERASDYLVRFKCLKYITFMAASAISAPQGPDPEANGDSNLNVEDEEARIAGIWHRACPTLRTIILPKGKVWFQSAQPSSAQQNSTPAAIGPSTSTPTSSDSTVTTARAHSEVVTGDADGGPPPGSQNHENDPQGGWAHL